MKELKVHSTSALLPFSYNSQENLERSDTGLLPVGKIFPNHADLALMAKGTAIEVIHTCNGARRSACNLASVKDNIKIQCVNEFLMGDSRKLLLGLDVVGWKRNGLICVYDLAISKVVRAIFVPEPVTFIQPLDVEFDSESILAKFSDPDKSQPLVIVGCKGGQVLIIRIGEIKSYDQRNDLSFPAELAFITIEDLMNADDDDLETRVNYAIDLSCDFYSDSNFRYLDHARKPIRVFKRDDISVTSLLYLKQAALLVAGYSFGCFQIWDSQSLQMIFSSSLDSPLAGITHLVMQEPENDPRHCVYLLVGRSPSPNKKISLPTTLSLYQLVFEFKDTAPGSASIYRELESVCKRFEHQLTSDVHHLVDSTSLGSRIIACASLPRQSRIPRHDQSSESCFDGEGKHIDTTLSYIVWESPPQEQHPSFHLGLFDINRWYHMQMPSSIRNAMYGKDDPVCPFFAFYSLFEVAENILPDTLIDAFIDAKDVSCFSCPSYPSLEQNFWPSSLSFKCTCLAERGLVKLEMLGMQRQILADLVAKGSEAFNETEQLFHLCWSAGLMPKALDVSRLNEEKVQFECLFSVAVEHNAMPFVMGCIRDWSIGEITNSGSCLSSVLQWAWKRVVKAKGLLDKHYISLFYAETSLLEVEVSRELSQCVDEIAKLVQVLKALKESPVSTSGQGSASLSVKLTVAKCISQYAEAIVFFIKSGILPECSGKKGLKSKVKHHICDLLADVYNKKREAMSDAPSVMDGEALFIDEFCKDIGDKIRDNDNDDDFGWDGKYPPPSVNVVCKTLLLDLPKDRIISFLFYWLLDVAEHLNNDKLAENAVCYFNITNQQKNVIEALWHIDRKEFEIGIKKLIKHGPELLPDAMKAIYYYGNKALACSVWKAQEMFSSSHQDGKLCIRILLENRFLHEAYKLQARYRDSSIGFELYQYFLEECLKNNLISRLFDLHLSEIDEDFLFEFLEKHENPVARDSLVVLCIKRHRYAEAIRYGGKLALERKIQEASTLFGSHTSKKAIMDMTEEIIPPIQRKLISFPSEYTSRERRQFKEVTRPEPLSAAITKKGGFNIQSHSDTIFKIIHSVEVNRSFDDTDEDISFDLPFVRSAVRSSGRKRRDSFRPQFIEEKSSPQDSVKAMLKPATVEAVSSSIPLKRRKHLHYGAEAMQLLKTPPVIKNPLHFKHMRSQRTPASILKRNPLDKSETASKSTRKRVVIADPHAPPSPVCSPESPSFLERNPFDLKSKPTLPKLDFTESPDASRIEEAKPDLVQINWQLDDVTDSSNVNDNIDSRPRGGKEAVGLSCETVPEVSRDKKADYQSETLVKSETDLTNREDDGTAQETNDVDGKTTEEPIPSRLVKVEDPDESELELIIVKNSSKELPDHPSLASEISSAEKEICLQNEAASGVATSVIKGVAADTEEISTGVRAHTLISAEDEPQPDDDIFYETSESLGHVQPSDIKSEIEGDKEAEASNDETKSGVVMENTSSEIEKEANGLACGSDFELVLDLSPESSVEEEVELDVKCTELTGEAQNEVDEAGIVILTDTVMEADTEKEAEIEVEADVGKEDQISVETEIMKESDTEKDAKTVAETELTTEAEVEVEACDGKGAEIAGETKFDDEITVVDTENTRASDTEKEAEITETRELTKEDNTQNEADIEVEVDIVEINTETNNEIAKEAETVEEPVFQRDTEIVKESESGIEANVHTEADVKENNLKAEFERNILIGDESPKEPEAVSNSYPDLGPILSTSRIPESLAVDDSHFREAPTGETSSGGLVTPNLFSLPSMRDNRVDSSSAVEELMKRGLGDLRVMIDNKNVTMHDLDTSLESQEESLVFTPSLETTDLSRSIDKFEREATPPKQAKIALRPRRSTSRSRSTASITDLKQKVQKSPVKSPTRSPSKSKRRSFHHPKMTRGGLPFSYTPPTTRLSSRKNTPNLESKVLLQDIGENTQLISPQISESAISFVPTPDSKQKGKKRGPRRSMQSPLVTNVQSPHSMTLRNRSKRNTPERFL